jgi:hypothetical protein
MKSSTEIQQVNQGLAQKLPQNSYTKHILNSLAKGDNGGVFNELCRFKDKGEPLPLKVIELVPVSERLPALTKLYGVEKISGILSLAITRALNNFNLRVGMNPEQIMQLSYSLIEEAEADQLAIQDVLLFLDGMVKYKYGKVYDRMDMPTFFEMLEKYREERHQSYINGKEEAHSQFKAMGDSNRTSQDIDKEANRNAMNEYLKNQYK